jgi:stage II sporulation protein P
MLHRRRGMVSSLQFKFGIISYLIIMLFIILTVSNFKLYMKNYSENNLFYVHIINYTLPVVKSSTFDEESLDESEGTLRAQILKIIGLNVYNPFDLMGKEVGFFKALNYEDSLENPPKVAVNINPFKINPFEINESAISRSNKNTDTENETSNSQSEVSTPANLINTDLIKTLNKAKPEVFIYHTHTTETFAPYGTRSQDPDKNICAVGDVISSELEKNYGIGTIHDKTIHDTNFPKAYTTSRGTLTKYINKYDSFKLIIDLHRDAGPKSITTVKLNNQSLAKIMFVVSQRSPYYTQNKKTVDKLMNIANDIFPGFTRDKIFYKPRGYYNQNLKPNTVLIEVGTQNNTFEEAKNSGIYIARIIAEYLNGKK